MVEVGYGDRHGLRCGATFAVGCGEGRRIRTRLSGRRGPGERGSAQRRTARVIAGGIGKRVSIGISSVER